MKKKPKWQTDKKWALRMAKKRGQRLPEIEHLFKDDPAYLLDYAKYVLAGRLPEELEASLTETCVYFCATHDREVANWVVAYSSIAKKMPEDLENVFADAIKNHINSPYDWGVDRCVKYIKNCGGEVFPRLEKILWENHNTAFKYSMLTGKRIPKKHEEDKVKNFDADEFVAYAKKIFKGRMPENLEAAMIDDMDIAQRYAKEIMFGQLPEKVHTALIMKSFGDDDDSEQISEYLRFVKESKNYAISVLSMFEKTETVQQVLDKLGDIEVID